MPLGSAIGYNAALTNISEQTRVHETTTAALRSEDASVLPPLMNPTILEASDDLTNLSHLNEPAGTSHIIYGDWQVC